jgi:hypothetical protein
MAGDRVSAAGEINGRKLELIVEDVGYDPKQAVLGTQNLVEKMKSDDCDLVVPGTIVHDTVGGTEIPCRDTSTGTEFPEAMESGDVIPGHLELAAGQVLADRAPVGHRVPV